jgi:hypothetical protein
MYLYPFTRSVVPYSGDEEFCLVWAGTRCGIDLV